MLKKIISSIFYLIVFEGLLFSQTDVFYKLYDYNNQYDGTFSIIQTFDNYFVIAGGTYNDTIPSDALFIIKINYKGDTIWKTIIDPNPQGDNASCVIEIPSHNYIICGTTKDSLGIKADLFLMNVSNNGTIKWFKRYGGTNNDYNEKVILTNDGGYLLAGSTLSNTNGYEDAYLVKTDSIGNLQWAKQYGGSNTDYFKDVVQTDDGDFLCAGGTVLSSIDGDVWLVKVNSTGDTLWSKKYGGIEADGAFAINKTSDNGFIVSGGYGVNSQTDAYILKIDSIGNYQWSNTFSRGNETDNFESVCEINGYYYAAGGSFDPNLSNKPARGWLMKINNFGDSLWSKNYTYYGGNNTNDYLYDMQPTSDGGFVLSGMITNNSLPYKNDIFVIKTDSLGNTCVPISTNHDGCWDTITEVQSPKSQASNPKVLVYPNPSHGIITLEYNLCKESLFELFDFTGKKVISQQINEHKTMLNLETLKQGIYFYKLPEKGSSIQAGKIVITK